MATAVCGQLGTKSDENRDGMLLQVSEQEEGGKFMHFGKQK